MRTEGKIDGVERYFDGPKVIQYATYTYNPEYTNDDDVDMTDHVITNFEAGKYKQWDVWLITGKDKRKRRHFAIDRDEIFIDPVHSCMGWGCCTSAESLGIYIMDIIKISPLNNPSSSLPDGFVIRYNDNYEDETDTKEGEGRRGEEVLCRDPIGANLPDEERCGLY